MADDLDFRVGLDGLQEDMSGHQRRFAREVTAEENRLLAADLIQRLDREASEAKPASPIKAPDVDPEVKAPATTSTVERKEGQHGVYTVHGSPVDDTKMRPASGPEHWFMTHAMPRASLLLTKPETGPLGQASWRQRTLAVMEIHTRVSSLRMAGRDVEAKLLERRFMQEFLELLEASSAAFGDWKVDAPTKLYVGA